MHICGACTCKEFLEILETDSNSDWQANGGPKRKPPTDPIPYRENTIDFYPEVRSECWVACYGGKMFPYAFIFDAFLKQPGLSSACVD